MMMKQAKYSLVILILTLLCCQVSAQTGMSKLLKKATTIKDSMVVRGVDRRYIDIPDQPWLIMLRGNISQTIVSMKTNGSVLDEEYDNDTRLVTRPSKKIGFKVGYRGCGIGYMVNVGGDKGTRLTLGATGKSYSLNVRYHSFENSHPDIDMVSDLLTEEDLVEMKNVKLIDPIKVKTLLADAYYMFNGKKFSYAAAYKQSVIQKRSAGSLIVGGMFNYTDINYSADSNGDLIFLMHGLGRVKLWQGSVGVGYAYNWVPCRGLLINVMAMPMLTFVNKLKAYAYDTNIEDMMEDPMFWNDQISYEEWDKWYYQNVRISPLGSETFNSGVSISFDGRVSVTYNFGRYFLNVFGQFNNIRYHHNSSHGYLNDWFVNSSIGIRL
jgi:hypothetical protein